MGQGFGSEYCLSDVEKKFIRAFDDRDELIMPLYTLRSVGTKKDQMSVIKKLTRQNIIQPGKPYRLTKLGRRLKNLLAKQ